MSSRDATANMVIERDLPITMDDGLVLRADVYRPKTDAPVPVIMTLGPYGKGVMYQDHYKSMWDWLIEQHPDLLPGSTRRFLAWETVDPEIWVPWGYAVVRVDSRGAGRSPGISTSSRRARRAITTTPSNGPALGRGRTARSVSTASPTTPSTSGTWRSCSRRI